MEEIWKNVKGYEGRYEISNLGNVRSLKRNGSSGGSITTFDRYGYIRVRLWKDSRVKTISVHKLVALHFIPNPLNKPQVNHKDGNKKNNSVDNLEWCSANENMAHAYKNGLIKTKRVKQIKDGKVIKIFLNIYRASVETKIQYASIYNCVKGKYLSAGGFNWEYAD